MITPKKSFWMGLTLLCSLVLSNLGVDSVQAQLLLEEEGRIEESDLRLEDGSLYDTYTFQGQAGQWVKILLESDEFDPYLVLFDATGNQLADSDDISKENKNAALDYVLVQDEIYQIVVNSYEPTGRGKYRVVVERVPANEVEKFQQLMKQGNQSAKQNYFPAAIASFQQALNLNARLEESDYFPILFRNLGFSYLRNGQREVAQKYYDNALQTYQRQLQAVGGETSCAEYRASILSAIATVHQIQGQNTESQRFADLATTTLNNSNNGREKAQTCPTPLNRWDELLLDVE